MNDKVIKVKRPSIQWNDVRLDLCNPKLDEVYFKLKTKHPKMSDNRCAYNALKHYYSTTDLARYRWLGVPLDE